MIRDVPLYTSGGRDPFTGFPTEGSPITGGGYNYQLLGFNPKYARLVILVTSLSGTAPSIQFTVGSPVGSNLYSIATASSPVYIYVVAKDDKTTIVFLNTSWQVFQQVELPYNIFFNGVYVSWSVSGTSPSIDAYIHFEFEDEEE
jgi:hypothetical protein